MASMRDEPGTQREFETIFILRPDTNQDGITQVNSKVRGVIEASGGRMIKLDNWGKRKLAYPIDKKEQGIYAVLRYETEPSSLPEFERVLRLDEQVLRQLTVVDPVVAAPAPARAARPAQEEE